MRAAKCGIEVDISIHAPARGATGQLQPAISGGCISIHAPARGATGLCNYNYSRSGFQSTLPRGERQIFYEQRRTNGNFNPRSREGSDITFRRIKMQNIISIHAPARGATFVVMRRLMRKIFQSTLPRGERLFFANTAILHLRFQSTLPRGERPLALTPTRRRKQFQSTLPRGERLKCKKI